MTSGSSAGTGGPGGPAESGGAGAPDDPLQLLLEVQDLDTALAQLQHRRTALPERRQVEVAEAELASLAARIAELGSQRGGLAARQAELERRVAEIEQRRQVLETRMYGARGSAARDLQAMDEEIRHLSARRSELEDAELEIMVEQDPLDGELAGLGAERDERTSALASLRAALSAADDEVGTEISVLAPARAAAAARLPDDLRDRYDRLRARLGGVGAARLVGNRCDGCHLELPSAEVDRIRHLPPGQAATCDQCGRILVRLAGPG